MMIRPAQKKDAKPCAKILRGWMNECDWFQTPHIEEQDEPFLTSLIVGGWTTVVETTQVDGFMVEDRGWIKCLYIAKAKRGQGFGKALLDIAKNRHNVGLQLWTYQDNERAQAFYLREGFREVERTAGLNNDERLPDIRYVWRLFNE